MKKDKKEDDNPRVSRASVRVGSNIMESTATPTT
jgi:hypothetical protein